jgi:hypothetical protein
LEKRARGSERVCNQGQAGLNADMRIGGGVRAACVLSFFLYLVILRVNWPNHVMREGGHTHETSHCVHRGVVEVRGGVNSAWQRCVGGCVGVGGGWGGGTREKEREGSVDGRAVASQRKGR